MASENLPEKRIRAPSIKNLHNIELELNDAESARVALDPLNDSLLRRVDHTQYFVNCRIYDSNVYVLRELRKELKAANKSGVKSAENIQKLILNHQPQAAAVSRNRAVMNPKSASKSKPVAAANYVPTNQPVINTIDAIFAKLSESVHDDPAAPKPCSVCGKFDIFEACLYCKNPPVFLCGGVCADTHYENCRVWLFQCRRFEYLSDI